MSQETSPQQEITPIPAKEEPRKVRQVQISLEEVVESLKSVQDDIGQICELTSEEKGLVTAFFEALSKLMQPLATTMPVSTTALPDEMGSVAHAAVDPTGHLILIYPDGLVELRNLIDESERDLMIQVMSDVIPKFKRLTGAHKREIENRIKFLSSITKELQKISKALSMATTQQ